MRALADHGIAATGTDAINIRIPLPHDEAMTAALGRCGWAVMIGGGVPDRQRYRNQGDNCRSHDGGSPIVC
jgi:hypothetical protein